MTTAVITVIERSTIEALNAEYRAFQEEFESASGRAWRIGRMLVDIKSQLAHGELGAWLDDNFAGSRSTAERFMRVAREYENPSHVTDLSLRESLKQVSTPKPKRATASDAGELLQGLSGDQNSSSPLSDRVDAARDRLRAETRDAWTDQETRKLDRAVGLLADAATTATSARQAGLSRYAISELVKEASNQAQLGASALSELAFSFEK